MNFFELLSQYDSLIDIVSCLFTVLALVFTLYLWLLDHLSDDESKFIEGKAGYLATLNASVKAIKHNQDIDLLLSRVEEVNHLLELILNYRFWARSKRKDEYNKINVFYMDTKYLISTIRRYKEDNGTGEEVRSLVNIVTLPPEELQDIQTDYCKGLSYIIDFLENWN
ncbi:MAG: hypothetical protein K5682_09025 [Lachnospiraceae bacterium]|nr:hypothetical protein [Lachnospiraceae bacterium]